MILGSLSIASQHMHIAAAVGKNHASFLFIFAAVFYTQELLFLSFQMKKWRQGRGRLTVSETTMSLVGRSSEILNAEPVSPCDESIGADLDTNKKTVICHQEEEMGI